MKYLNLILAAVLFGIVAARAAQDTTLADGYAEVRDPVRLKAWLEANASDAETRIAAVEAGTLDGNLSFAGTMTVVSTNGASTNVIITVNGVIDGEHIADDTIDNDSIDWADMTDLTTDGAVSWGNIAEGELGVSKVTSSNIKDGEIVAADIATDAAIASTQLAQAVQDSLALADSSVQTESDPVVAAIAGIVKSDGTNISAAVAGTDYQAPLVAGTDYLAPAGDGSGLAGIAATPAAAGSVSGVTNTVTITAKDGSGATNATRRLLRVWMSEAAYGAPSTNNIESVTLSGGTAIQTVTAAADYVYLTADTGIASAEIVGSAAGTNYINVADGGYVTSAAVVFE